jgi:uncharacterized repeat protein (TIGR01451 family)
LNGLGHTFINSAGACIDKDGDGYGVGPGCLGPDADDLDPAVHTGAQFIAKWGTLAAGLAHLGYNPLRIWYLHPTSGNDTTCMTGSYPNGVPVGIGSPCLNATLPLQNLKAGDMVIYRAGTYTLGAQQWAPITSGTSTNPIVVMAYPGESVTIDATVNQNPAIYLRDVSWHVYDGFKLTKSAAGCIDAASGGWFSNTLHDITVRHVEAYSCFWGYIAAGFDNLLLEDYVGHDNKLSGAQHAVYWGSKGVPSSNGTIRRSIAYNNDWNGFHINGNISNLVMEQNIAYNNGIANFDWMNGVHNSFFRSNLSFQGGTSGAFNISVYAGTEGMTGCGPTQTDPCTCSPVNDYSICAHDQTNNLIENFTAYQGQYAYDGSPAGPVGIRVSRSDLCNSTTPACLAASQGNNTFRNITAAVFDPTSSGSYQPISFPDLGTGWPQSSTFDSLNLWLSDSGHSANIFGYGPGSPNGYQGYTCSSPPAGVTLTKCINADPKFTAVNPTSWYTTPALFDLHLLAGSPALHSGTSVGIPAFDLIGNTFANPPSLGAYEFGSNQGTASPSVTMAKSVTDTNGNPVTSATPGATLVYTITYQNQGAGDAANVRIQDSIPAGTTYVAGSAAASASGVTITQPSGANGNTIFWTIGTVHTTDPVQSVSFKVTVN